MVCPCSQNSVPETIAPSLTGNRIPLTIPDFNTSGNLSMKGNTGNAFVDLASVIPFSVSSINAYISSLADALSTKKPKFFNTSFLYSIYDNLISGNYLESSVIEDKIITNTYVVPYDGYTKIETATVITITNTETNILYYKIPSVFTYESIESAAVAIGPSANGYDIIVEIPYSFFTDLSDVGKVTNLNITLNIPKNEAEIIPSVFALINLFTLGITIISVASEIVNIFEYLDSIKSKK